MLLVTKNYNIHLLSKFFVKLSAMYRHITDSSLELGAF